jgi:hypothetical protein
MRIVLAAHSLAGLGGSETYVVTVADHLQRLGHDVWLHSPEHGRATAMATRLGVRVCDEHGLPPAPDALVVQDGIVSCALAAHYPLTPQAFVAHSDIFDLQLPPQLPGLVAVVVVLYERVEGRIRALALDHQIVALSQPIDVERFKPTRPLRAQPRIAVAMGSYLHGQRIEMLTRACARVGIELRHVGAHSAAGVMPAERVYDEADLVFGKARVILEAMACGRAAYVLDHNGGDGWVTAESYPRLAPDNFGGQTSGDVIDEDRLVADLRAYDPGMGLVNRDLVVARHTASKHAAALAAVLLRLVPRAMPIDAPLTELARLVRLYHRVDAQAFALHADNSRIGAQLHALEQQLERERAEHGQQLRAVEAERERERAEHGQQLRAIEAERERERAEHGQQLRAIEAELAQTGHAHQEAGGQRDAHAAEAARLAELLDALRSTRRWRAMQAALAPADRLRGRRRVTASASPAPFIVGVPRSGTTVLRFMLDAHSQLAIGPETGFGLVLSAPVDRDALLTAICALETWPDLGLDAAQARALLGDVEPWSIGGGLRALYTALARRAGKARWGDKTPVHLRCMPAIAGALPEAHFIHIIRDGRDVAASLRGLPFAPGDLGIEAIAEMWRTQILMGRAHAQKLAHYQELRFDRLVHEPEQVMGELCAFIDLDFQPSMLRPQDRAPQRMAELAAVRRLGDGTVTRDERIARNALLMEPLDPSRAGRWEQSLTVDEVRQFEAIAGDLLDELGYR